MKKYLYGLCVMLAVLGITGGCTVTNLKEEKRTPLDYTVAVEEDIPEEIQTMVEEKQDVEFQFTYQDGNDLYLVKGYGRQEMGGYSIQVEELSKGNHAIFLRTHLAEPQKEDESFSQPSYPVIVLKLEFMDMPVEFECS